MCRYKRIGKLNKTRWLLCIKKIEKISGNKSTYTITFTDGKKYNFTITNGIDGQDGTMPRIKINYEMNGWEVTYDYEITWETLGVKATSEYGINGVDGVNGSNGILVY